ncbi:hypothetical protein GCM10022252_62700 [Streptosporangium oxazolinicum]|uniref:Secreted protein n=1 Tax=Streptosporangium oxazolinicum TaxID=909287 RepID=A0ABP8BDC1_9ACTN
MPGLRPAIAGALPATAPATVLSAATAAMSVLRMCLSFAVGCHGPRLLDDGAVTDRRDFITHRDDMARERAARHRRVWDRPAIRPARTRTEPGETRETPPPRSPGPPAAAGTTTVPRYPPKDDGRRGKHAPSELRRLSYTCASGSSAKEVACSRSNNAGFLASRSRPFSNV